MRAAATGARAEEGTVRREVTTTMAVAYYRLGYAVTALETLRHRRELLDAAVQLSTTRYATGAAPQSDPLQAKLARDRLRSEEFALESERVAALAGVNALRNRAPGDSLALQCERSEEHTSELQSQSNLVCRLLLEKKKTNETSVVFMSQATLTP